MAKPPAPARKPRAVGKKAAIPKVVPAKRKVSRNTCKRGDNKKRSDAGKDEDNSKRSDVAKEEDNSKRSDVGKEENNSKRSDAGKEEDNSKRSDVGKEENNSKRSDAGKEEDSPKMHFECSICLEDVEILELIGAPLVFTECAHSFCTRCISTWVIQYRRRSCPVCRQLLMEQFCSLLARDGVYLGMFY